MKSNREHRAAKTTAVVTAFGYAGMAVSFISVPILLRWLGVANYGLMLTALAFMTYLSFADAGLNWGSMILIGQANGSGDRTAIANIFRHSLVLGFLCSLVAFSAALAVFLLAKAGWRLPMFGGMLQSDRLVLIVALQCAVILGFNAFYNVFNGIQEGYYSGLYQGLARLSGAALSAFLAWRTRDPAYALGAYVVTSVVFGLVTMAHLWRRHPWVFQSGSWSDRPQYRLQIRTGAKNFGLQIARTVLGTTPVVVIGALSGPAAVPLFSTPSVLVGAAFGILFNWNASLQTAYGEAWASGNQEWVRSTFDRTVRLVILVAALTLAIFPVVAPDAIALWTAGRLHPSVAMCLSVAGVACIQAVGTTIQFCLVGINRHRGIAAIELVHCAASLLMCAIAVRMLGTSAVGLGAAAAYVATAGLLGFRELRRHLGKVPSGSLLTLALRAAGTAAVIAAVGRVLTMVLPPQGALGQMQFLVVASVVLGACSIAAIHLFGWMRIGALGKLIRDRFFAIA